MLGCVLGQTLFGVDIDGLACISRKGNTMRRNAVTGSKKVRDIGQFECSFNLSNPKCDLFCLSLSKTQTPRLLVLVSQTVAAVKLRNCA